MGSDCRYAEDLLAGLQAVAVGGNLKVANTNPPPRKAAQTERDNDKERNAL